MSERDSKKDTRHGQGRGHGRFGGRSSNSQAPKKVSRHEGVMLLTGGPNSNVITWKKRVQDLLLEKYGDLV